MSIDPATPAPANWADSPGEWERLHQALVVRARALNPEIVFLGDSITQGWDATIWAERWAPLNAVNMGIGGDQTQQILWRIEHGALEGLSPKLVILLIGVNNLWNLEWSADEVAAGVAKVVAFIRQRCPDTKVLVLGILPAQYQPDHPIRVLLNQVNERSTRIDDGATIRYLDIGDSLLEPDGTLSEAVAPDGCHLSAEGYRRFADAIEPVVRSLIA
jgi:beta-glucosidase